MSTAEEPELPFEDAIDRIERIVATLERGDSNLTDALAGFEEGERLLNRCQGLISAAEKSIALLTGIDEATGAPRLAPFDAGATVDKPEGIAETGRAATVRPEPPGAPFEADPDVAEDVSGRAGASTTKRKPRPRPAPAPPPMTYDSGPSDDFVDDDAPF